MIFEQGLACYPCERHNLSKHDRALNLLYRDQKKEEGSPSIIQLPQSLNFAPKTSFQKD